MGRYPERVLASGAFKLIYFLVSLDMKCRQPRTVALKDVAEIGKHNFQHVLELYLAVLH